MIPNLKMKKIINYFSTTGPVNKKARILADTTTEDTKIMTPVDISESDLGSKAKLQMTGRTAGPIIKK